MIRYRIEMTPDDNDTFLVTSPDLPLVLTFGETREDAKAHAVDAIETALASMMEDRDPIPIPDFDSTACESVRLPVQTDLKVRLYMALREAGLTRADLQRQLGWKRESVDRLFRLDHNSRIEQLAAAFQAMGREIDVFVTPARIAA